MSSRVLLIGVLSTTSIISMLHEHLGIIPFFDIPIRVMKLVVKLFFLQLVR